jgi:hypothetical protein
MSFNFERKKFKQFLEQKGFEIEDCNYNEGLGDILRGIGGFIGGAKRGWKAGWGTQDMGNAEYILEKQINVAFDNFTKNLVRARPIGATIDQQKDIRKFLSGNIHSLLNHSLNYKIMKKAYNVLGRGKSSFVPLI